MPSGVLVSKISLGIPELPNLDVKADARFFRLRKLVFPDCAVKGEDDAHIVPQPDELCGKFHHGIRQAAGSGQGGHLAGGNKDLHSPFISSPQQSVT